jgi:hypothetical protein
LHSESQEIGHKSAKNDQHWGDQQDKEQTISATAQSSAREPEQTYHSAPVGAAVRAHLGEQNDFPNFSKPQSIIPCLQAAQRTALAAFFAAKASDFFFCSSSLLSSAF